LIFHEGHLLRRQVVKLLGHWDGLFVLNVFDMVVGHNLRDYLANCVFGADDYRLHVDTLHHILHVAETNLIDNLVLYLVKHF
jgi:hypothetical protein